MDPAGHGENETYSPAVHRPADDQAPPDFAERRHGNNLHFTASIFKTVFTYAG